MTPEQWDAEVEKRAKRLNDHWHGCSADWYVAMAQVTMDSPRPEEPKCVKYNEWTITHDGERFTATHPAGPRRHYQDAAYMASWIGASGTSFEPLTLDLIALRDGAPPRYEVVGWRVVKGDWPDLMWSKSMDTSMDNLRELAERRATVIGGTVEPIYKKVTP